MGENEVTENLQVGTGGIAAPWWAGRMLALDLETTHKQPELARVVQYGLAWVGGGEPSVRHTSIVNPGVPISAEATEVHGITNERAEVEGVEEAHAVEFIVEQLAMAAARHLPVVVMNAPFDLTIIDRRARQHGVDLGDLWSTIRVADPRPIDSILDKYRRSYPYGHDAETAKVAGIPSTRTLAGLCGVYGVELGQAHDAAADALAAARILYVMASRGEVKRKRWDAEGYWAKARWAEARGDLDALHALQCEYVEQDRPRFAEYKRRQAVELDAVGDAEGSAAAAAMADRIDAERGWPVLEVMAHEVIA